MRGWCVQCAEVVVWRRPCRLTRGEQGPYAERVPGAPPRGLRSAAARERKRHRLRLRCKRLARLPQHDKVMRVPQLLVEACVKENGVAQNRVGRDGRRKRQLAARFSLLGIANRARHGCDGPRRRLYSSLPGATAAGSEVRLRCSAASLFPDSTR